MNALVWFFNFLLVPLLCSTYSSLIVVRYIEFSQLRTRAEEVIAKTQTYWLAVSVRGVEGFEESYPAVPGQIAPRFQFGELEILGGKFRKRGHINAANEATRMTGVLLKGWSVTNERGKLSEAEWEEHGLTLLLSPEASNFKPSVSALFSVLHWNI
jgi:hypothetical protein